MLFALSIHERRVQMKVRNLFVWFLMCFIFTVSKSGMAQGIDSNIPTDQSVGTGGETRTITLAMAYVDCSSCVKCVAYFYLFGLRGNQPFFTRSSCFIISWILQRKVKLVIPNIPESSELFTKSDAITAKTPITRNTGHTFLLK